ncbi:protein unc-93 homolog A-like [Branchiostoma floridae x Branchiostoma japonicum]
MEKTTPRTKLLKEGSAHQLSFTKRIWKNILVLASVFLLNFTAFKSLQNLQSTLNSEAGLGVVSLSCVYASMVLSCLYAPFFIHKVGSCKWTIVVCFSDMFFLLGAISGPLWTAQITYLTSSAQEYAELLQHDSLEGDIAKFNGIFYLLNDLSGIIGNLISSLLFSAGTQDIGKGEFCGGMDCGIRPEANYSSHYVTNSSASYKLAGFPDDMPHVIARYVLLGIFLVCNILATLVAGLCLDKDANNKELSSAESMSQQLLRTVYVFKDIDYVLLVPLLVIIGMSEALVSGDITKRALVLK